MKLAGLREEVKVQNESYKVRYHLLILSKYVGRYDVAFFANNFERTSFKDFVVKVYFLMRKDNKPTIA